MSRIVFQIWMALALCVLTCNPLLAQDTAKLRLYRGMLLSQQDTTRTNGYRGLGNVYMGVIPDSAIYYARMGLLLAERIHWTKGIAQCSLNLGANFNFVSNYDSAIFYATKALAAAKIVGDKNRLALIYVNRGGAYAETQQYEKAMLDNQEAVRLSDETGDKDRKARAAQNMCALYMALSNYRAAEPWAETSYQLNKEIGNDGMLCVAEMSIGGIAMTFKQYAKATDYLNRSIERARASDRPDILIESAISLAVLYLEIHDPSRAVSVIQSALPISRELRSIDRESALCVQLGKAYVALGEYNLALLANHRGLSAVVHNDRFQARQQENLMGIAEDYYAMGDFRHAFDTLRLASALGDSVIANEKSEQLVKLQTQFETNQKEKQIALLQKQQQLDQANLQRQRTFRFAAYIIVALLLLIGVLLFNRFRTVHRNRRTREMEQVRNHIARDLHDDIGSTLTSINILSKVALQQTGENEAGVNILKIKERSAGIMDRMNDIVWAINPVNDSLERLLMRMREFLQELCEQAGLAHSFVEKGNMQGVALSLPKRNQLYLVFKEMVNNAVKYSGGKGIVVELSHDAGLIGLTVTDDGQGFDTSIAYPGNGLRNLESRAAELGATFRLKSGRGQGTVASFRIPVT